MALPQVYEGTAEEIAEQLRGSKLTGKLKAIITRDEVGASVRRRCAMRDLFYTYQRHGYQPFEVVP